MVSYCVFVCPDRAVLEALVVDGLAGVGVLGVPVGGPLPGVAREVQGLGDRVLAQAWVQRGGGGASEVAGPRGPAAEDGVIAGRLGVTPGVAALQRAAARGELPLGLGGQPPADPATVGVGGVPAHPGDGAFVGGDVGGNVGGDVGEVQ